MYKIARTILLLLFVVSFSGTLMGDDPALNYFPATVGSSWVYEDQDGNEFTRRVVEGEEIAGELYQAFEYEPSFESWENYEYHIHPTLLRVDDSGIKFHIGDNVKKAYKKRLTKEMEEAFSNSEENMPPEIEVRPKVDIEIDSQDVFYLLHFPITLNEEWDAMRIKPTLKISMRVESTEDDPELAGASYTSSLYFTIIETGNILAKETVETPSGKFDNCLKIEYRTETVMPSIQGGGDLSAGESATTLWLAPDVGIVKFHKETDVPTIREFNDDESTTQIKTYELKKYEIKSETAEEE